MAACMLGDEPNELSELKLPNCDSELSALRVAAVALFALFVLLERDDSFVMFACRRSDAEPAFDEPPEWFGITDAAAKAAIDRDVDVADECLLFDWLDFFADDDDGVDVAFELCDFPTADDAATAAACIASNSLCSVAGLYWFDDDLYDDDCWKIRKNKKIN